MANGSGSYVLACKLKASVFRALTFDLYFDIYSQTPICPDYRLIGFTYDTLGGDDPLLNFWSTPSVRTHTCMDIFHKPPGQMGGFYNPVYTVT